MHRRFVLTFAASALALGLIAGACGSDKKDDTAAGDTSTTSAPVKLRLGYFPNITHATALVGVKQGIYAKHLTGGLETQTFNAGPAAIEALFAGAIDATYVGPNPAINAWAQSNGKAIKIIAGATSGGAALVVKPEITKPEQLKGKTIASPQLGNTQDVALRWWLKGLDLKTDTAGGGDVKIVPQENSQTLATFQAGDIDGAWVPEPWVTRLVQEGGGKVLVNERDLWETGDFVTTHLIVSQKFLKAHPDVVKQLIEGHVEATKFVNDNPTEAQTIANGAIQELTGKALKDGVVTEAWKNLTFTNDPIAASLHLSATHAQDVGLLKPVDLDGIYDLSILNSVLKAAGESEVKAS
jgi:NitT/TauT family transport system substrate-binding protein